MTVTQLRYLSLLTALGTLLAGLVVVFAPEFVLRQFTTEAVATNPLAAHLFRVSGVFNFAAGIIMWRALAEFFSFLNSYSLVPLWFAVLRIVLGALMAVGIWIGLFNLWVYLFVIVDLSAALSSWFFWTRAVGEADLRLTPRGFVERLKTTNASTSLQGINFYTHGTGKRVVLFIHGFGATCYSWRYVLQAVDPDEFTVYAIDLKGCGQSAKPRGGKYSLREQSRLVLRFIAALKIQGGIQIVGHSMGGGVALMTALALRDKHNATRRPGPAARAYPPLVGLILINSMAFRQRLPWFLKLLRSPVGPLLVRLVPPRFQVGLTLRLSVADAGSVTDDMITAYAAPLRTAAGRAALVAIARQIIPDNTDDLEQRYGSLDVPTLLIWGRQDRLVRFTVAERLLKALPNCALRPINYCGHIPQEETPDEVVPLVWRFLASKKANAGDRAKP